MTKIEEIKTKEKLHMATSSPQRKIKPWEVDGFVFGSVCQAGVCVINWKAESAVYVISLAAQGFVSAWNLFRTDGALQFEPNFYWVAPAEIDPAF